ncbi:hypothetical protein ACFQY4_08235 [Catellatospora bangladeshensis]|uniref:hypothetical protein n=1 Tax=Catellatospora bangladeshensis TaxID=310355 RepID=UPI003616B952
MTRPQPHATGAADSGSRLARSLPVALPALVTLVTVLIGHERRALWRDEYATWWAASLDNHQLQLLLSKVDAVFAPFYVFTRAWVALFGDGLTSLRLPSALAMAAAAGLVGALGRRLFSPAPASSPACCSRCCRPFRGMARRRGRTRSRWPARWPVRCCCCARWTSRARGGAGCPTPSRSPLSGGRISSR